MAPYGLTQAVQLPEEFTARPPGLVFDLARQLSTVDGKSLADQPDLMLQFTVTWRTTGNDNKTDDGG